MEGRQARAQLSSGVARPPGDDGVPRVSTAKERSGWNTGALVLSHKVDLPFNSGVPGGMPGFFTGAALAYLGGPESVAEMQRSWKGGPRDSDSIGYRVMIEFSDKLSTLGPTVMAARQIQLLDGYVFKDTTGW